MELHLHLDRHEWAYATTHTQEHNLGTYRTLQCSLNGRPFACWYHLNSFFANDESYMRNVDEMLARQMERMVQKICEDALAAVPAGVDLIGEKGEDGLTPPWHGPAQ